MKEIKFTITVDDTFPEELIDDINSLLKNCRGVKVVTYDIEQLYSLTPRPETQIRLEPRMPSTNTVGRSWPLFPMAFLLILLFVLSSALIISTVPSTWPYVLLVVIFIIFLVCMCNYNSFWFR